MSLISNRNGFTNLSFADNLFLIWISADILLKHKREFYWFLPDNWLRKNAIQWCLEVDMHFTWTIVNTWNVISVPHFLLRYRNEKEEAVMTSD